MADMNLFSHNIGHYSLIDPVDINGVGADSLYFDFRHYGRFVVYVHVGAQAGATTITVEGTGDVAVPFNYRLATTDSDVYGALTAATAAGVATDGATAGVTYAIEMGPGDFAEGTTTARVRLSSPGVAAVLVHAEVNGFQPRFKRGNMTTMVV